MFDIGELVPFVAILATAWVIVTSLHYKNRRGAKSCGMTSLDDGSAENQRLARENERLQGEMSGMKSRLAVLEAIATDPAERTSREIERLR